MHSLAYPDSLLVSRFPLPAHPTISYVLFKPNALAPQDSIELARRSVLSRNTSASLLESLLESVQLSPEPLLYIFKLTSHLSAPAAADLLATLDFPGLTRVEISSFTPPTVSSLLPNSDIRHPISHFYQAVRSSLIHHVVDASTSTSTSRRLRRFKNGFLISHVSTSSDWEYKSITRPLLFCALQVLFSYSSDGSPSHLVFHPTLVPTPFLDIATSLPLPPGTPITLLPYGTPAYFLATYNGPTAGLIKQFRPSLHGIGAGLWDSSTTKSPTFIIAWIKVENKQGEDKGITVIYPTALCLSYIPLSTSRPLLDYIPELPAPLQPSPQVAPAVLSISQNLESPRTTSYPPRPSLFSSPTSDSLQLFRGLTLSKANDLRQVATEVGSYVDAVARERERERERLKRERESGSSAASPKLARTSATTPASVPTPISTDNAIVTQPHLPPPPPPLQPAISMQNFYPSPPHTVPNTVPASEGKTSPAVESSDTQPMDITSGPSTLLPSATESTSQEPAATNGSYDLFSMDSYNMGMDLDLDDIGIDFDMNMGSILATASSAGGTYAPAQNGSMRMEYEDAFTDEDFSFFDAPARSAPTSASGPHFPPTTRVPGNTQHAHTRSTSSGGSTSHIADTHSGPSQQTIWTPGAFGIDGFTPRSIDHHDSAAADHLLSPGQTPFTHTARHDDDDAMHAHASSASFTPAPPNVHLEYDPAAIQRSASHSTSSSHTAVGATSPFEPIPFSKYHREADGKYAVGKFAFSLPSPPPEDDDDETPKGEVVLGAGPPSSWMGTDSQRRTRPKRWRWRPPILRARSTPVLNATVPTHHVPWSPTGSGGGAAGRVDVDGSGGWRFRYEAATDPRIGVVRKLIGVKRKIPTLPPALAARKRTKSTSWVEEDWGTARLRDGADVQSAVVAESEEEEEEEEEEDEDEEDIESPMLSRPTTPPPAYLPLGPTLLHTQFQHAHLLPLSTPLRPPGAAVAPINLSHPAAQPPPSVPTPVSPAATMGAANEKSKSLETAAFAIAAEVVENPVWGETWRASAVGAKPTPELWSADYKAVASLLEGVQGLESRVSMEDFFELGTPNVSKPLQPLEAPMISIGKGEAIIQVQPPALRFWEKLGLNPKAGKKDVSAIAIFEDDGEQGQGLVESWLSNVCSAYDGKHYGTMSLGKSGFCTKDGLVPLRFDSSFRKNLASFLTNLVPPQPTLVIFLILPLTVMSLSSPVLRQVLSVSKKVLASYRMNQFCLQFVPQPHLFLGHDRLSAYDSAIDQLCSSVYNRILVPVDRITSRRLELHPSDKKDTRRYFMGPSFTLARPLYNKVSYVRAAHTSLDVMDRYTLLHVGYHLTACGKWILASCVDQRGEAHDLGVWLTQSPADHEGDAEVLSDEEYAVKRVWEFAVQFAKKTDVEWRVVFTRLGVMTESELNAWTAHFASRVVPSREQPPLHHTLACVVPDAPWSIISSKSMVAPPPSRTSSSGRSPSSSKQQTIFTDITASTYAIFPKNYIPISLPPSHNDLGLSQSIIPEPTTPAISSPSSSPSQPITPSTPLNPPTAQPCTYPESSSLNALPHPITILPQHTSILIRVPHASSSSAISMTQIHLLHTSHSASYTQSLQATSSAQVPDNAQLLADVTRNFHELAVLSRVRFKLDGMGGANRGLPFHLAAVDAMRVALDRDWERLEGGSDL